MRQIKFRGRWSGQGSWVYGGVAYGLTAGWVISVNPGTSFVVDQESIGQFTGLHDKNGKEIYEGDILKAEGIGLFGPLVVEFTCGAFGINDHSFDYGEEELNWKNYEVIGNVYEHPDLLK